MKMTLLRVLLTVSYIAACVGSSPKIGAASAEEVLAGAPGFPIGRNENTARELPDLGEEATLSDYLAYAALNNPGLEAAFNRWQAAREGANQARFLPDPRFSYSYFIKEVETRVGPQRQRFELAQKFPWFGVLRLQGEAASEAASAAEAQYQSEKLNLFERVTHAYYEYYYLMRATATVRQHRDLMKSFVDIARARYRTDIARSAEVIRAQVELGKLDDRLRSLQDLRGPAVARLNAALNRPQEADLPDPNRPPQEPLAITEQEILAGLAVTNPELGALDHEATKEEHRIDLARKQGFPDFTLGLTYIDTDEAVMPGASDSGKDPIAAMLSINLPIWREKYRAAEREAAARHLAVAAKKEERQNALEADIAMTMYKLRDAERKVDLYRDTLLPKARQSMNTTEAAFRAGSATLLDLLDAERILLEFELSGERAFADRGQSMAKLEALSGRSLSRESGFYTTSGGDDR